MTAAKFDDVLDVFSQFFIGTCGPWASACHTGPISHAITITRFLSFIAAPLFTESATEREMHAVDSENSKNLTDDGRR